jgi:hypothetical protein
MSVASQLLPATETICQFGSRPNNPLRSIVLPFSRGWANPAHLVAFATYSLGRRQYSSMTSESLNPSQEESREHRRHASPMQGQEGTPYAARAAAGAAAASNSFFPLGYREGFSQWVSHEYYNLARRP